MTTVISAGPRAVASGEGALLHYSSRAVNLKFGGRVVTLMNRGGILTPSGAVLDLTTFTSLSSCRFEGRSFISDALSFTISEQDDMYVAPCNSLDVRFALSLLMPFASPRRGSIMNAFLAATGSHKEPGGTPVESAVFQDAYSVLRKGGSYSSVASSLLGKGFGLTPSGDDFITGMVAIMRLTGCRTEGIRECVECYGNAFSRTMLLDALDGYFSSPLLALVRSILSGSTSDGHVSALLSTGHTSGSDTLAGMLYALERESGQLITGGDKAAMKHVSWY